MMIPPGVRGNKRGWNQVELIKFRFRKLLFQFKTNKEIMLELGLKKRTFYRYKSLIIKEDTILWRDVMRRGIQIE